MITVRYHIASLCAVILTLGIGIWVGLAIASPFEKQQTELMKSSVAKLDLLLQERQQDVQFLDQNRQALTVLVPHFTHGLLSGKTVVIIRTGDYPDAAQSVTDALSQTGCTLSASIAISGDFDDVTQKERTDILGPLATLSPWSDDLSDNDGLFHTLVQALKDGTANHQSFQDAIDRMSSAGLITYSGDFSQPANLVVVVGGASSNPNDPDTGDEQAREKELLDELLEEDEFKPSQVIGCEPRDVGTSSIPTYQDEGISSVDCVDEPLGGLDLVFALHGESAAYGVKSGSSLLVPASLEPEN